MDVNYREITKKDYGKCAKVLVSAYAGEPWKNVWTTEEALLRVEATMSGVNARGFVAVADGEIIAQCLGRIDYYNENWKQFCVDECSILADFQGKGIGTILMNFVSESLKQEEIDRIWLLTGGEMAVKFYEKNGFKVSNEGTMMTLEL